MSIPTNNDQNLENLTVRGRKLFKKVLSQPDLALDWKRTPLLASSPLLNGTLSFSFLPGIHRHHGRRNIPLSFRYQPRTKLIRTFFGAAADGFLHLQCIKNSGPMLVGLVGGSAKNGLPTTTSSISLLLGHAVSVACFPLPTPPCLWLAPSESEGFSSSPLQLHWGSLLD